MINFKEIPMSEELHNKLDNIQVNYVFQPIYDVKNMCIVAYEALMRPIGMSPLELIDEYKEQNKLHLLELITVYGAFKEYKDRGYECDISINSFPEECMTDEEENMLHTCFPGMGRKMIVEILEYTNFDLEKWVIKKRQIDGRGIRISIDDYGTGNNNNYEIVDTFSPNCIKLDRSIIMDIHEDEEKRNKVEEFVKEFHSRGISVLAEGIEKKEELDVLIKCGIDLAQGYYLGRPA